MTLTPCFMLAAFIACACGNGNGKGAPTGPHATPVKVAPVVAGDVAISSEYVATVRSRDSAVIASTCRQTKARDEPKKIEQLYVRSETGEMVSLGSLVNVKHTAGPHVISHYNLYRSADILGSAAPGKSTGEAITRMQALLIPPLYVVVETLTERLFSRKATSTREKGEEWEPSPPAPRPAE